jgi:hypothetical protein
MKSFCLLSFLTVSLLTILPAMSQERKEVKLPPEATEVWEPEPRTVTPGPSNDLPPEDAVVLFDGESLGQWESVKGNAEAEWTIEDGALTVTPGNGDIKTKESFGDVQLHIEWKAPSEIKGEGQGRGNSGLIFMGKYEVQILDSYDNRTYSNGQAGSVYKQYIPLVNAMRPPGEWNTYEVIFMAPKFNEDGIVVSPARITVFHNGVLVQNHVEVKGTTEYIGIPQYQAHEPKLPIHLQDHGDLVSFRNIWLRKLD